MIAWKPGMSEHLFWIVSFLNTKFVNYSDKNRSMGARGYG